jgi:KUP system potassium uptake protein
MRAQYGFMQDPNVPDALLMARAKGLDVDLDDVIYFLGRETIIVTRREGMSMWREHIFAWMARSATSAMVFFNIPPNRVVELGTRVEL